MAKLLKRGSRGDDVKSLQTALNDAGAEPQLKVDSQFGKDTEAAVKAFQKKHGLKQDGVAGSDTLGKLAKEGGPKAKELEKKTAAANEEKSGEDNIKGADILKNVDGVLQKKIVAFAEKFGPITISSGKRSLTKQAELMAPMSDKDLAMYEGKYVEEIQQIPKKERTAKKVAEILAKWQKKGSFISRHLQGTAVDIEARGGFDWTKAKQIAKRVGLKVKAEEGRNCFHVEL